MSRILVVDDDAGIQRAFQTLLKGRGHEILSAGSGEAGLQILETEDPDLILLDVWMPGINGLETFQAIKARHARTPVIVMTGAGTMNLAIEASKIGAFDFRLKPFDPGQMLELIDKALDSVRLTEEPVANADNASPSSQDLIIGGGPAMQELFRSIGRVAPTDATVLIRGASGTGKELVARAIRQHSRRSDKPMVLVNCAAIPETLLESELFGYERGAFTGADKSRTGMFDRADGGSILLDEIGDVPLSIQAKILRVLQDKTFERIGGAETVRVDVRILAATNRDLEQAIAEGRFREDLYHRLNVVTIHLPLLRERREDIPALAQAFLARFAKELEIEKPALSDAGLALLSAYDWPGNVRELEHCLRRALIFTRGFAIQKDDLLKAMESKTGSAPVLRPGLNEALRTFVSGYLDANAGPDCEPRLTAAVEKELLMEALRRANGNQSKAAELLGIPRPTLHAKLQRHGVRTSAVVDDSGGSGG
jgi:two-component system NtrC family response regulator/two-component system nitrogen regulation response regulator GlnG